MKGDHGRVLVVAGSARYTNTPAIVSLGALRTGVDIVTLAAPEPSARAAVTFALNIISEPLPGPELRPEHVDTVLEQAGEADCIAIGPGLGREAATQEVVIDILDAYSGRAVVDADAIHAAAQQPDVLGAGTVVTPHAGEFEALTGEAPGSGREERKQLVAEAAAELGCTVLLKGHDDVISDGEKTVINESGNPSMTRGGTGDILTGVAAGLLAQGLAPLPAAETAAAVTGAAGDRALEEHGEGFLLEEMLEQLSTVV